MESGDKIASLSLSLLSSARGPPPPSPPSREGGGGRGSATGRAATTRISGGTSDLLAADLLAAVSLPVAGDLAAAAAAAPLLPGATGAPTLRRAVVIPKHKVQIKIDCTLCTLYILVHLYYDVVLVYSSFVHLCDDVVHIRGYIARERRVGTKTSWPHALGLSHCLRLSRSCGSVAGAKQHFRTKRTQKFTLLFTSRQ